MAWCGQAPKQGVRRRDELLDHAITRARSGRARTVALALVASFARRPSQGAASALGSRSTPFDVERSAAGAGARPRARPGGCRVDRGCAQPKSSRPEQRLGRRAAGGGPRRVALAARLQAWMARARCSLPLPVGAREQTGRSSARPRPSPGRLPPGSPRCADDAIVAATPRSPMPGRATSIASSPRHSSSSSRNAPGSLLAPPPAQSLVRYRGEPIGNSGSLVNGIAGR